jgi:hypothetical protein
VSPLVTILLYVIIPVAGYLLIAALVLVRPSNRGTRYRSGGPWNHEPVWWIGNPDGSGVAAPAESSDHSTDPTLRTARGGARGTW